VSFSYVFSCLKLRVLFIPLILNGQSPGKPTVRILIASAILFLIFTILGFNGYRLKGIHTLPAIGLTFILSTLLYFVLFKNTKKKILTVLILTPLIVLSTFTLLFGRILKEFRVNDNTKIIVTTGGFLSCGEIISITQTKFGVFDKEVLYESSLCLRGISKIVTTKIDDKHAEFLIFHNGEFDSENPYKYDVERKNVW